MDMDDAPWFCLVCERQILPKRSQIPVSVPPAPPSSPSDTKPTKRSAAPPGGLVRGTGRVGLNGTIKLKTVIDKGPLPLYCSDECQLKDMDPASLPLNYNPNRHSMPSLPVYKESKSMATLCKLYNFPPLPPPHHTAEPKTAPAEPQEFNSGVMMASKYIEHMLEQNHRPPQTDTRYPEPLPPPKVIPGWNDGSNAWRATVYSFSSPASSSKAYDGFQASPHRSDHTSASAPSPRVMSGSEDRELLMTKYSAAFNRRAESAPSCSSSSLPKRERSLVAEGAKLLVPDVKLRVRSGSSSSLSSMSRSGGVRPSVRSPLSVASSDFSEDTEDDSDEDLTLANSECPPKTERSSSTSSANRVKRPVAELRSWSYDNMPTYPIMPYPEGYQGSSKKLFLFPGKPA